jgi:hypothetical protein
MPGPGTSGCGDCRPTDDGTVPSSKEKRDQEVSDQREKRRQEEQKEEAFR